MARLSDEHVGVTKTWNDDKYKAHKNIWKNKHEYTTVVAIRDRFSEMAAARRTSCVWASPYMDVQDENEDNEDGSGTGSNWADRWNLDDKQGIMWHEYERDRSNLKSPTSFAPIQAALSEFMSNDIGVSMNATQKKDEPKIKLHRYTHDDWERRYNVKEAKKTTFLETIIRGTSIPYNGWMLKTREVDIMLSSKMTEKELQKKKDERKEEVEAAKDEIIKNDRPLTKREELVEWNNCIYVPTSLFEIFVDPDARYLRAPFYEATDIVWRQMPSLEQFRSEFKGSKDPYVIKANIDKVRTAMEAHENYQDTEPFFEPPEDAQGQKIELLRYYNKQTDKYIVVANDVLVREGPLPYNHKELPFSRHICYELKDQFYGAGIPVMLESLQSEDETLRNMALDHLKIKLNPPLFINTQIFPDIDLGWERVEAGLKVEVNGDTGPQNVRWFDAPAVSFDYERMRNTIQEDVVSTTGINPTAYSSPRPNEPVRTHILAMESSLKMVKKMMQNWGDGWVNTVKQLVKIREQLLPEAFTEEVVEGEKIKKYPTIKTENVQLEINFDEEGNIELEENGLDDENGYFDFATLFNEDGMWLGLNGDADIQIDTDSMIPRSHGLKVEQIDKGLQMLLPILSNPDLLKSPGISQLVRNFIEVNGLDHRIAEELQEESSATQIEWAKDQEEMMFGGERVQGVPGESDVHKMHHVRTLIALMNKEDELEREIQTVESEDEGAQIEQRLAQLSETVAILTEHLAVDDTGKAEQVGVTMEAAQQSLNPEPEQPEGGTAPAGGMTPEGMPQMGGGASGQPPMPGMGGQPPMSGGPGGMPI